MFQLIIIIVVWGVVHSWLASLAVKEFVRRRLGDGFMRFYRLLYNVFSVVSILPVLYLMIVLPDRGLYQAPAPWSDWMRIGQVLSAVLLIAAVMQTDPLAFVGLRQMVEEERKGELVTNGFYRFIRHPLYTFGLLILWLSPSMTVNSFLVYAAFTIYILIGIYFEEQKLLREFGQEYARYRSATPMLIPALRFGRNK